MGKRGLESAGIGGYPEKTEWISENTTFIPRLYRKER